MSVEKVMNNVGSVDGVGVNCEWNGDIMNSCQYRGYFAPDCPCCDYVSKTGTVRGCSAEACTKYKEGEALKPRNSFTVG